MRSGQPFSMRYPLVEVEGSYGNLMESGNWSSPRYCLTGDALVSTDKGLIPIKDIVESEENSDNKIPTLTCRGVFGHTTTNLIFNSGLQQTYKLTLKNKLQITGTPNHPLLTIDKDFNFVWKTIEELKVGDKILVNLRKDSLYGMENDIEYARVLGCLVSEGSFTHKKRINMINSDLDMVMPVSDLLHKYGSKAQYYKRKQKDGCYVIETTNAKLYHRLEQDNCIHKSTEKSIPKSVFKGTREYQIEFLKYLFEGDGCVAIHNNSYGTISYSSISEKLIRELQILLLSNFGIVSSITKQRKREELKLELGGEDAYIFCKEIGFVSDRKNKKAIELMRYYENQKRNKSTGTRGWRIFKEIKTFLEEYYPELIVKRYNRPNECKGPLMGKDGLPILKRHLSEEDYRKIEYLYTNFALIPIIEKENAGLQVVYSPKINEKCNSFTANGIINHNTETRLSALSSRLFKDLDKDTISSWKDNYDDTEKYPTVLPSKGYYNIVNGTSGIGVGAASSLPSTNIREVNTALIKLLWDENIPFEEIYCAPDFPTGGILLNAEEVKESFKNGKGKACKIRSVVEYDKNDRCFIVKEIPYGVYTNTICGELENILNGEENPGIDRFNDLTGSSPNIKIYLTRTANPSRVIKYLYKHTSLQSHYGINMTMLEDGRFPRVFTWKEALQAYLTHEKIVYRKGYEYDLQKIKDRLHIVEGILKCLAHIEEVIQIIKSSSSTSAANDNLCKNFGLTPIQAKAILDIKLARLARLEVEKYENERDDLLKEKARIEEILNDTVLFKKEIEKDLLKTIDEIGDDRRTQILNTESDEEDEPIEVKNLLISLTNQNNLFVEESSSLYTQRRGGRGGKFKLSQGEYVISQSVLNSNENLLLFTKSGKMYSLIGSDLIIGTKVPIESLIDLMRNETICSMVSITKKNSTEFLTFFTKKGIVKRTKTTDYLSKRKGSLIAIALDPDDSLINVELSDGKKVLYCTKKGQVVIHNLLEVRPSARNTKGVIGIRLNDGDEVVKGRVLESGTKELVFATKNGLIKRLDIDEITQTKRSAKGSKCISLKGEDEVADCLSISIEREVVVVSSSAQIKLELSSVPKGLRGAAGVKAINLADNNTVVGLTKI